MRPLRPLTAACFAAVALTRGFDSMLLVELPFVAMLVAVAATDLERRVVPDRILLPAALYGLAAGALLRPAELAELLTAGAGAFLALLPAALAHPAGMGMGDVKLAGVMGLYLGGPVVPALLVAFVGGALVGLGMIARHGLAARKRGVPFAPFLALGGLVSLLADPQPIELYADLALG